MFSVCKSKGSGFKTLIYDIFNHARLAFADHLMVKPWQSHFQYFMCFVLLSCLFKLTSWNYIKPCIKIDKTQVIIQFCSVMQRNI